jgi:hypothetical protein
MSRLVETKEPGEDQQKHGGDLADFTTTIRVVPITALAVLIGLSSTGLAWLLMKLIGFCTNLFYYQRLDGSMASPAGNHLGCSRCSCLLWAHSLSV